MVTSFPATLVAAVTTASLMHGMVRASGGNAWSGALALISQGHKTANAMEGRYHSVEELRRGYFKREADYGVLSNAEGLNAGGRWRQDSSGQVHKLNSQDAAEVTATEAFIARRGYLRNESGVKSRLLRPARWQDSLHYRLEVTPPGGRSATLWIGAGDLLVHRITMQLSERVEEIRLGDYRTVAGLRLPFHITLDHGDELDTGSAAIDAYSVLRQVPARALDVPTPPADVSYTGGTLEATVPATVDKQSEFLILLARVNGAGPYPFILDTGGHDILTPATASQLRLSTFGTGKSYGAGPAATATAYTKVQSLQIGDATVRDQPFTILHLDLGEAHQPDGTQAKIAGILGLEVFERFAVTIDFRRQQATFARQTVCSPVREVSVPITFTSDMPLAPAAVDGESGTFGIDTGNNSGLILFNHWLLKNALREAASSATHFGGSSVGGDVNMHRGEAASFRFGGAEFVRLPIMVSEMTSGSLSARWEAGNLGLPILSQFSQVTFDYPGGKMCLQQHA